MQNEKTFDYNLAMMAALAGAFGAIIVFIKRSIMNENNVIEDELDSYIPKVASTQSVGVIDDNDLFRKPSPDIINAFQIHNETHEPTLEPIQEETQLNKNSQENNKSLEVMESIELGDVIDPQVSPVMQDAGDEDYDHMSDAESSFPKGRNRSGTLAV